MYSSYPWVLKVRKFFLKFRHLAPTVGMDMINHWLTCLCLLRFVLFGCAQDITTRVTQYMTKTTNLAISQKKTVNVITYYPTCCRNDQAPSNKSYDSNEQKSIINFCWISNLVIVTCFTVCQMLPSHGKIFSEIKMFPSFVQVIFVFILLSFDGFNVNSKVWCCVLKFKQSYDGKMGKISISLICEDQTFAGGG